MTSVRELVNSGKLKEAALIDINADIEIAKLLDVSPLTPCQITGKPGLRLKGGALTIPTRLSPEMCDIFTQRMQDSIELNDAQSALDKINSFTFNTTASEAIGNPEILNQFLDLLQNEWDARIKAGRRAITVLEEMKAEFGSPGVSS